MSATDAVLTGLAQASAPVGLTRGMTHTLRAQGFDIAAALFGAPDAAFDRLPSQARAGWFSISRRALCPSQAPPCAAWT